MSKNIEELVKANKKKVANKNSESKFLEYFSLDINKRGIVVENINKEIYKFLEQHNANYEILSLHWSERSVSLPISENFKLKLKLQTTDYISNWVKSVKLTQRFPLWQKLINDDVVFEIREGQKTLDPSKDVDKALEALSKLTEDDYKKIVEKWIRKVL